MDGLTTPSTEITARPVSRLGRAPIYVAAKAIHEVSYRPWRSLAVVLLLGLTCGGLFSAGLYLWKVYHFHAGQAALRQHRVDEARDHFSRCLNTWIWPNTSQEYFYAARAARRAGVFDAAGEYLTRCQELDHGTSGPVQLERVLLRAQAGDLASIEYELWGYAALADSPATTEERELIWECLGVSYMLNESRPGRALTCFGKALEINPNNLIALHGRASVFERMSNFPEAEADLRKIIELYPKDERAKIRLAGVLLVTSRADEALKLYDEASPKYKGDATVIIGTARCKVALNQVEEAVRILDDYLARAPEIWDRKLGDNKTTPVDPSYIEALTERGKIATEMQELKLAEKYLRRAVELNPFDRQANHALYICLNNLGQDKEARELLPKLRQIEADIARLMELFHREMDARPRDPDPLSEIGRILMRNGQVQFGLYWLQKALLLDRRHQPTNKFLYEYYESIGNKEKALEYKRMLVDETAK